VNSVANVIKDDVQKGRVELRRISWFAFVITSVLSLCIGGLITLFAQSVIIHNSAGNLQGERLKSYIEQIVSKKIDGDNVKIASIGKDTQPLNEKQSIIVFGTYELRGNEHAEGSADLFVAILEKREKGFLNYLFSTEAAYYVNYMLQTKDGYIPDIVFAMKDGFIIEDYDNNGTNEFGLMLQSLSADHSSTVYLIFSSRDGKWGLCNFELDNQIKELEVRENGDVMFDSYKFYANNLIIEVKAAQDGGGLYRGENPFMKKTVFCYTTPFWRGEVAVADHDTAFFMFDFDGKSFTRNESWNGGKPLAARADEVDMFAYDYFGEELVPGTGLFFYR